LVDTAVAAPLILAPQAAYSQIASRAGLTINLTTAAIVRLPAWAEGDVAGAFVKAKISAATIRAFEAASFRFRRFRRSRRNRGSVGIKPLVC
jgi:hypothetical protein